MLSLCPQGLSPELGVRPRCPRQALIEVDGDLRKRWRGTDGLFGSMGLCYMPLCSGASMGIPKVAMVHQHDLSSHRTDRDRRALVSPLEPRSDGFIGTSPGRAVPTAC